MALASFPPPQARNSQENRFHGRDDSDKDVAEDRVHQFGVCAGLRHARAKGKRLGRPRKPIDADQIKAMRAAGLSWRAIARRFGLSVGTVFAAAQHRKDIGYAQQVADD